MELCGWSSPQMLRRYGASARSARPPHLRPHHDRRLTNQPQPRQVNAITTAGSDTNCSAPPDHPTETPQVRVPEPPHSFPTDKTTFCGTLRHSW
jgi:hypothetical protein